MREPSDFAATERSSSRTGGFFHTVVFLLILALGAGFYFTPAAKWLTQGQLLQSQLAGFGLAAPLVFAGLAALLIAVGAPRLLLCSLAGAAFGFAWGLLWSQLGTLLGAYASFLMVRRLGREAILRRYPQLNRFTRRVEEKGIVAVLLIRQLPMNGFYNNLLLGLTPVRHRDFLLGSLLGYLPLGVTATLIGAGLVQNSVTQIVQYASAGLVTFVILGVILRSLIQASRTAAPRLPVGD